MRSERFVNPMKVDSTKALTLEGIVKEIRMSWEKSSEEHQRSMFELPLCLYQCLSMKKVQIKAKINLFII